MGKKIAVALGILLLIAVIIGAVIKSQNSSSLEVNTAEARMMKYEDKVLTSGRVELVDSVELFASTSARLVLKVQEGDSVKKGQVLAELDLPELRLQLREAEAALKAAEAGWAGAQKAVRENSAAVAAAEKRMADACAGLERTTALVDKGKALPEELTLAQNECEKAEEALQAVNLEKLKLQDPGSLQLQVNQARAAVDSIRFSLEQGKLKAPFNGLVYLVTATSGSYVQPGVPLIMVGDPGRLQVAANLSEQDIFGVEVGQAAEVRWAGSPEKVIKGKIDRIAPIVSGSTMGIGETEAHVKVYLTIKEGHAEFKPGATVDVAIYRIEPRQSLLVPNEALIDDGRQKAVFVVEDGIAKSHTVQTGSSNELFTEIKRGITEKSLVILEPDQIQDGQKVRPTGGGNR